MSQILRGTGVIKTFLYNNKSYVLNVRHFSRNIKVSPVLRNVGILLKKNKNSLSQLTKVAFHPGANNLVPIGSVAGAKPPTGWEVIKQLLRYVWPKGNWGVKQKVIIAMCLLVGAKVLNIYVPFLMKDIINYYNDKAPKNLQLTLEEDSVKTILTTGICLIIGYGLARSGSALFNELRNAVFARVSQHSVRKIAHKIFLHLHNLDLAFHLNRQTGALSKAIDRGTRGMSFVLSALIFNVIPTVVEVSLVSGIFYIKCGAEFSQATLACLGTYAISTLAITRWRTKFRHEMNQADNDAGNKAVDSLINYETVKYFNNEKFEAKRYDYYLKKYQDASLKTSTSLAFLNFTQNAIFSTGLVGVMALGAGQIQAGNMNVADLVLINTLFFQLSVPLNFLGSVYREIRQGLIDMTTMFSLMSLKSNIYDSPNAIPLIIDNSNSTVVMNNIHFGYIPNQPILKGLDLEIPTGKKVAIVGGSGCGKSTIVRLLYRLYDSNEGTITINGQSNKDVTIQSLRESISIVPQDCVLFHDTIFYNLKYGNPNATDEEVYEAARLADLHEAVLRMPNGYETMVGERGLKLSGGEKQRVAIARAILKNANIVIYDEATSSLDAKTEENIMRSLRNAFKNRTSLFIAHRLATIVDADIIYVLEDGKVIEKGNHKSLLENKDSKYTELWNYQHHDPSALLPKVSKGFDDDDLLLELNDDKCCGSSSCNK
uniref:Iron-sulfur clusters transporter ABCB7, mitochondrial n=1 Tax=Parastrongyloides trichosuri TaxID=131310 RepID=A0A0N5A5E6_PARTI